MSNTDGADTTDYERLGVKQSKAEHPQRALAESVGSAYFHGGGVILRCRNVFTRGGLHVRIARLLKGWGWSRDAAKDGDVWHFLGGGVLAVEVAEPTPAPSPSGSEWVPGIWQGKAQPVAPARDGDRLTFTMPGGESLTLVGDSRVPPGTMIALDGRFAAPSASRLPDEMTFYPPTVNPGVTLTLGDRSVAVTGQTNEEIAQTAARMINEAAQEKATPAVIENSSGLYTAWLTFTDGLPAPHRGHALQPGERFTAAFPGKATVEADAEIEVIVTRW